MECFGPAWVLSIIEWFVEDKLSAEIFNTAIYWLYERAIITCEEIAQRITF